MIKILKFTLYLLILVGLAVWLADRPGTAHLVWHDYVIDTSAAFLGLCAFAAGFVIYLVFRVGHLIKYGPERWRLGRKLRKMRQGQEDLTAGLIAVAGGNAVEAGRLAVSARKKLGTTAATQLLLAQAAQLAGDRRTANELFRMLAAKPESAVLGYRGLIMEARREQNWGEVDALMDKLARARPDTPWLNLIRFESAARRQDWENAKKSLAHVSAVRLLEPARSKQYRAALLVASSQDSARLGHTQEALQSAEQALKQAPGWLPAIINLARRQMGAGHKRAAHRTIEKYWQETPHPQLAAAYRSGDIDALEAYKQIEKLCRGKEEAPASRMALAEAALAADIWGEARRHLIALVTYGQATQTAYRLLARLEKREGGGEKDAAQWLLKAVDAPLDPTWLCRSCGGAQPEWKATCSHCGGFDTLDWQSPGQSRKNTAPLLLANSWMD